MVIVGTLAYDDLASDAGTSENTLGGSATYAGLAAAFHMRRRIGEAATLPLGIVSPIGEDFRASALDRLEMAGLNLAGLDRIEGGQTFRWKGRYEGDMSEAITLETQLNVLQDYAPAVPAAYWSPRMLFLANFHPEVQLSVLKQCEGAEFIAVDSMNLWIDIARPTLCEVLRQVDLAVLNDGEVRMLANDENLIRAARAIMSGSCLTGGEEAGAGPRIVIVKKGEHGVVALVEDEILTLPAFPTAELVDPAGCGDTFAGTLLSILAEVGGAPSRTELHHALVHATVTASFTLSAFGTEALVGLDRAEYHARLDAYRRATGAL